MESNVSEGGIHRLYVANVTRQTQVLCYRLDYNKKGEQMDTNRRFQPARQQEIPPGRQAKVGSDMHMMQITDIVDQLSRFGLIGTVDVPRIDGRVHPYVYSIDRPVPASVMEQVRQHNAGVLVDQGRDRRLKAAVATNDIVQKVAAEKFLENGIEAEPADRTDVVIEQEEQSEAGERRVEVGVHVVPEGEGQPATMRGAAATRRPGKGNKRRK